jgi:uncharacterized protein (TIGR03067 family)
MKKTSLAIANDPMKTSSGHFVLMLCLCWAAAGPSFVHETQAAEASAAQEIFNGKDLTGWTGNPKLWSVKDGAIVGQTTRENPAKGNTFLIWTNGEVGDFELRCQFRIKANNDKGFANSGIQYRSQILDTNNWVVGGYQADMEAGPTYTGILYEERMTRGIMATRGEKVVWDKDCKKQVTGSLGKSEEIQAAIKKEDWNEYVIKVQGNHLQHFINGKQTVDVTDDCESKRATNGVLALQLHAGEPMTVEFKDLRLSQASGKPKAGQAADDLHLLQGTWHVVSAEQNGEVLHGQNVTNTIVVVTGTTYRTIGGNLVDRGTFKIDSAKTPRQMDIKTGEDETLLAIYELGAEQMRICYAPEEAGRPTSFSTSTAEPRYLLLEYRKKKE